MTELLDVLDENYGEEDSKNRNDRNALELVLYPPVHEDDIDSVGDSASDNDVGSFVKIVKNTSEHRCRAT